jgi:hypothetical protein
MSASGVVSIAFAKIGFLEQVVAGKPRFEPYAERSVDTMDFGVSRSARPASTDIPPPCTSTGREMAMWRAPGVIGTSRDLYI